MAQCTMHCANLVLPLVRAKWRSASYSARLSLKSFAFFKKNPLYGKEWLLCVVEKSSIRIPSGKKQFLFGQCEEKRK